MDIILASNQLALFFDGPIARPDKLGEQINKDLGNCFDAVPTILSLPKDAPSDIPSVMMSSDNGEFRCSLSRLRCDFFCEGLSKPYIYESLYERVLEKYHILFKTVDASEDIVRLGLVLNLFIPAERPVDLLKKKYLQGNVVGNAYEVFLKYVKKRTHLQAHVNDAVDFKTAFFESPDIKKMQGLLLVRDINTDFLEKPIDYSFFTSYIEKYFKTFDNTVIRGLIK